jgi:hypothetical protein
VKASESGEFMSDKWMSIASTNKAAQRAGQPTRISDRATRWLVLATGGWALLECPLELLSSQEISDRVACIAGKIIWLGLVWCVMRNVRASTQILAFLCALNVSAIVFSLPEELWIYPPGFAISAIECALKAAVFIALFTSSSRTSHLAMGRAR